MDETKEIDIDLRKIFYMMRTKVVFILLITVVTGVIAGCFTHFFIDPTYSSTVKLYVYSNTNRVDTDTSITPNDITASQELVNTYVYVLQSDTVLDKVIQDLSLNTSVESLKKLVSAKAVEDTLAFQVTVNSKDREMSAKIANSIAKIAPDEIVRVIKAGGVEVIDYAKVPSSPSSPNLKKNILVGALAGFLISFLAFFIYEMFDTTITNSKDLERDFEIPVLGTIPRLEPVDRRVSSHTNSSNGSIVHTNAVKPSASLLESIQSVKEDTNNEQ